VKEGGGGTLEGRQKQEARSEGHHGGGGDGMSWDERRDEAANTASRPARMGDVARLCGAATEMHVMGR